MLVALSMSRCQLHQAWQQWCQVRTHESIKASMSEGHSLGTMACRSWPLRGCSPHTISHCMAVKPFSE